MVHRWLGKSKAKSPHPPVSPLSKGGLRGVKGGLGGICLLLALGLVTACGAAATPTPKPAATLPPPTAAPTATKAAPAAAAPAATVAPTATRAATPVAKATPTPTAAPQPTPTRAPAAVGVRGGIVPAQAFGNPDRWDPHESGALTGIMVTSPVYNQLIEFNPETDDLTDLRGDLARNWELSKDGLTYTFRLHEKAKWWDGKPVTAEDVVFSLERMVAEGKLRPRTGLLKPYYKSSRVIDPLTVEVTTKFPAPAFLPVLATDYMAILPKHHLATGVDISKPGNILGSGPFKLKEFKRDVSAQYVRNPDYFKEPYPYFDGMNYFIIVERGSVIAAYRTEQVLFSATMGTNLSDPEHLKLEEDMKGKLTAHKSPPIGGALLAMNTKIKPFDDARVRRAVYLAVDRQALNKTIKGGLAVVGTPTPPGYWWGPTDKQLAETLQMPGLRQPKDADIAEAKRLLAEAGYPNGFKVTYTAAMVVEFVDVAQVIADQLRKINIEATVKPVELASSLAAAQKGDFELFQIGEGPIIMDPDIMIQGVYTKGGVRNYSNWSHPRIDQLYELQQREPDPVKRKAYVDEVADIILKGEGPSVYPLYWNSRYWVVNHKIKNFHMVGTVNAQVKNEHLWLEK